MKCIKLMNNGRCFDVRRFTNEEADEFVNLGKGPRGSWHYCSKKEWKDSVRDPAVAELKYVPTAK